MNNTKDLTIIVQESGLETTKAKVLLDNFSDFFRIAEEWEKKARVLNVTSADQKTEMKMAREGRLFLREKRIEVEKTRKRLKEQSLREGKAIDGVANVLKSVIVPVEEYLKEQENFVKIQEEKAKVLLQEERVEILSKFEDVDPSVYDLKEMDQELFEALVAKFEQRVEDIKKEKEAQIQREKEEAEERERVRKENEKLKKEAKEKEKALEKEREQAQKKLREEQEAKEAELKKQKEAEDKKRAKELAEQKAKMEAKAEKERKEAEKKQKALEKKLEEQEKERKELEENQIQLAKINAGYVIRFRELEVSQESIDETVTAFAKTWLELVDETN